METHNTIKILENKIILKKESEELTFEPTKNPSYPVKMQYLDVNNTRYFLTKTKKTS
jgi:hypothetical protein